MVERIGASGFDLCSASSRGILLMGSWGAAVAPEPGFSTFRIALARVLYEAVNELASQTQNTQGREMLNYIRRAWEVYIGAYLQEAEWIADEYVPTMEEYIENGINSFGLGVLTLHCILLLNQPLTDHILGEIDMPSRFHRLVGLAARLRGDAKIFRTERARGEVASSVSCYMKGNPGCE
eukprot:Gb_31098 [translate_table: standard]